jgi:5-methylcytosine-specific restriction endonuclease McrA
MPMDKSRYPADWNAISLRIRERDGQCCKFCGVPNGAVGQRDPDGKFWTLDEIDEAIFTGQLDASDCDYEENNGWSKPTKIVLTVAHLGTPHADGAPGDKHDKFDVRDENLAALCQRCHLAYDMEDHIRNRRVTLARKKHESQLATGQLALEI